MEKGGLQYGPGRGCGPRPLEDVWNSHTVHGGPGFWTPITLGGCQCNIKPASRQFEARLGFHAVGRSMQFSVPSMMNIDYVRPGSQDR